MSPSSSVKSMEFKDCLVKLFAPSIAFNLLKVITITRFPERVFLRRLTLSSSSFMPAKN